MNGVDLLTWRPTKGNHRKILEALLTKERTLVELVDLLYGDREDGGPDSAEHCIHVTINNLRRNLHPRWKLEFVRTYRLVKR